jgi:hypothetical protein
MTPPNQLRIAGLAGGELSGEVTLSPGTELGIEVTGGVARSGKCTVAGIEPAADGKSYVVRITAAPVEAPVVLRDSVEVDIRTSDGVDRKHTIQVNIDHQDRILLNPPGANLVFQRPETQRLKTPGSAPVKKPVQIFASAPEIRFQVLSVEILDAPEGIFATELRTVKEGERYQLDVSVLQYSDVPTVRGQIKITTDDPKSPEKVIRLYAQFGGDLVPPRPGVVPGGPSAIRPGNPGAPAPRKQEPGTGAKPGMGVAPKPEPRLEPPGG